MLERFLAAAEKRTAPARGLLAEGMRATVRCAFPLVTIAVLAGLLYSAQGRDVLLALLESAARPNPAIGGLAFLAAACVALSLSLWYSMRWLLIAQMPGLPLRPNAGRIRVWLPRVTGALAPLLVAWSLFALSGLSTDQEMALWAAGSFAALGGLLFVAYAVRGRAIDLLVTRGWMRTGGGRVNRRPHVVAVEDSIPGLTLRVIIWSILGTFLIALIITLFPVTFPRVVGGAAVAAFALASINLFGSFVLTYYPLRYGLPHQAPWVLLVAGAFGFFNDNHVVAPAPVANAGAPIPLTADFARFLNGLGPEQASLPVIFVASEGGGIRAAYWTAAVLEALREEVPEFERHTYALSGVSGGSLGIAAWLAVRRAQLCMKQDSIPATTALAMDFVSPAIGGVFYYDLIQRFLPVPIPAFDRARTMETGWQRALWNVPGRPLELTLTDFYSDCDAWLPHMLLNATRVETGQRAILTLLTNDAGAPPTDKAPLPAEAGIAAAQDKARGVFTDTFDAMAPDFTTRTQTVAGLVHHSARFPLVSPAGTIERIAADGSRSSAFRLVDGGYFDNSGVQTALELIDTLRGELAGRFTPILLIVRNDASEALADPSETTIADAGAAPAGGAGTGEPGPSGVFPEVSSVVSTLLAVRGAHAVLARETAERQLDSGNIFTLNVTRDTGTLAPLGWALSATVRQALDADALSAARARANDIRNRLRMPGDAP